MARRSGPPECELCRRYFLPGEPVHRFEEPDRGGRIRAVCALCQRRALTRGWLRSALRRTTEEAAA
jgi:hypothetical protein